MAPKLIAEEGLLKGSVLDLESGDSWTIGRDNTSCELALNDPSVSRRHAQITFKDGHYEITNLSLINPILIDRKPVQNTSMLRDGSVIQIGSTWFRFTQTFDSNLSPEDEPEDTLFEEKEPNPTMVDIAFPHARWMLKVIAGPNSGAEFFMEAARTYLVGKDPSSCDILFQDRSVSNQHLSLTINEDDEIEIVDLESKNGAFVDGKPISDKATVKPQESITLGTTTFIVIDTKASNDTLISEAPRSAYSEAPVPVEKENKVAKASLLSRILVPTQDLVIAGVFGLIVLVVGFSTIALFKSDKKEAAPAFGYESKIKSALSPFHDVEFSYDKGQQKLFLAGHVTSTTDKEQLSFNLDGLKFLKQVDDSVIVDELVWQEMNVVLAKNPDWRSITLLAPSPGHFVVTGYLKTASQAHALQDYLNLNFPLIGQLQNRVAV
ncbi:MAG: EscD/YscD/HrpQ family type III secretion system inner membrane ring protein, partial [Gimesia sp.]|nr:EscD/YscD/HrpQ family type III secretion system inner membrane ring protein [Gimesia sp.]